MADPAPATGNTVSDVASRLEGFLAGVEPGNEGAGEQAQQGQAEGEQLDAETADQEGQETAQDDESGEKDPEEGDAEQQEQPAKVASDDMIVTVKVDGKDERVTVKELSEGFLRERDYTRKTQALAEERKALEPERQVVIQERQQYASILPLVVQFLQAQLPPEPNPALMEQDPIEYARQNNLYSATQRRLQAAIAEQQRMAAIQGQQTEQQRREYLEKGRQTLHEAVPEWKDPKKWEADRTALAKYALTRGYSEDEVAQATDPRAILLLRDSMELANLKAKKPEPAQQRGPRQIAAGAAQSAQGPTQGLRKARATLKETGRVEDAANALMRLGVV